MPDTEGTPENRESENTEQFPVTSSPTKSPSDRSSLASKGETSDSQYQENTDSSTQEHRFFSGKEGNEAEILEEAKKELEKEDHASGWLSFLLGVLNIAMIIGIVVLIRFFLISPFKVDGHSMDSTFAHGDLILIDKISYRFAEPDRGDVIVFYPPVESSTTKNGYQCSAMTLLYTVLGKDTSDACVFRNHFVKRVIGVPGDTIELKNGKVFVTPKNGERVEIREDFLDPKNRGNTCIPINNCENSRTWRGVVHEVPEGAVYVLGDNRTGSSDSRMWTIDGKPVPFVPMDNISGKVRLVFWPFPHMEVVSDVNLLQAGE